MLPLTLHTAGLVVAKLTGKPELALATRAAGKLPRVWVSGAVKLMVCAALATVKLRVTAAAAA